mgnify:CR=1 FL=1
MRGNSIPPPDRRTKASVTMRSARRRRYVARTDVMEVLYRVYLGGLAAIFGFAFLAGALPHAAAAEAGLTPGDRHVRIGAFFEQQPGDVEVRQLAAWPRDRSRMRSRP